MKNSYRQRGERQNYSLKSNQLLIREQIIFIYLNFEYFSIG